jgi:hypothetical protein
MGLNTKGDKMKGKKTFIVTLEFDNADAAGSFFAYWLDGGGDGGGNLDWNADDWADDHSWMRIKGTGEVGPRGWKEYSPERQIKQLEKWIEGCRESIRRRQAMKRLMKKADRLIREQKGNT